MTIENKYVIVRNADNEIIYYDFLESGEISTNNCIETYDALTADLQKEVDEFLKSNNN
jgi:hypothetical protein